MVDTAPIDPTGKRRGPNVLDPPLLIQVFVRSFLIQASFNYGDAKLGFAFSMIP